MHEKLIEARTLIRDVQDVLTMASCETDGEVRHNLVLARGKLDTALILTDRLPEPAPGLTAAQLADALEYFGNEAVMAMHNGTADVGCIAQGLSAVSLRLAEIGKEGAPVAVEEADAKAGRRRRFTEPMLQQAYDALRAGRIDPESIRGTNGSGNAYAVGYTRPDVPNRIFPKGSRSYAAWAAGVDNAIDDRAAASSTPSPQIGKAGGGPVGEAVAWLCIASDGGRHLLFADGGVPTGWASATALAPAEARERLEEKLHLLRFDLMKAFGDEQIVRSHHVQSVDDVIAALTGDAQEGGRSPDLPMWGRWVKHDEAPSGSYACLSRLQEDAPITTAWMPAQGRPTLPNAIVMPFKMPDGNPRL